MWWGIRRMMLVGVVGRGGDGQIVQKDQKRGGGKSGHSEKNNAKISNCIAIENVS